MEDYCLNCSHIEKCKHEYGDIREDGDDYRAISGTHFCRKSWDNFKCCNCQTLEEVTC